MDYKYRYDPESDVLAVYLSKKPFDYATEMGDLIVHFDKGDTPVYVEILNASGFLSGAAKTLPKSKQRELVHHLSAS